MSQLPTLEVPGITPDGFKDRVDWIIQAFEKRGFKPENVKNMQQQYSSYPLSTGGNFKKDTLRMALEEHYKYGSKKIEVFMSNGDHFFMYLN